MNDKIVIGLGFGDEGKGRTVDYLCSQYDIDLVVRFSGGHQAAHGVYTEENSHIFSNFGSGTLRGVPTYFSKYCTVDPIGILNEFDYLKKIMDIKQIKLFIDAKCPIVTSYDKCQNLIDDKINKHGSCGVGFGRTLQREEDYYSLLFEDLYYPSVLKIKLEMIKSYYGYGLYKTQEIYEFINACKEIIKITHKTTEKILSLKNNKIFEGSQGLLLDKNIGFFPHVTRSNTDLTNIKNVFNPDLYFVTRAYQTRHGNGPMTNENIPIKKNVFELNNDDGTQGKFRSTALDLDLLKYSLDKFNFIKYNNKRLVVTCLDVLDENYILTENDNIFKYNNKNDFIEKIANTLDFKEVLLSEHPYGNMKLKFFY